VVYVVGKLKGASAAGITGVEFRIEVSNPAGWTFTYSPPAGAAVVMGDPMDRNPSDPDDGSGRS
jgi:hypothetical protein